MILAAAVFICGVYTASAQTAPVSGTVEVLKDGKREPAAGALIEVYRTDIKAGFPSAKTSKKGEFSFAGLPLGGVFVFSVSAPGCSPTTFPNVRAGQEKLLITLVPGDGSKLSEADVRKGLSARPDPDGGAQPELTAEQKKQQAEHEAEVNRVAEKNKKIGEKNELFNRVLKEGTDAFNAKNYDLALAKFSEGLDADPEFVGSAPIFLSNKGIVLTARAIDTHNKGVTVGDAAAKLATSAKVKSDLVDAADSYLKAWNILKTANPAEVVDKTRYEANKISALVGSKDTFRKAVMMDRVDPALVESAKLLLPEYLNLEGDAAKKLEGGLILGDLFRLSENRDDAVAAYKAVLEKNPENIDALAGVGLVLVDISFINNNDKLIAQEGANYLQRFVSIAPDTHKLKQGAVEYLALLKAQSITPEKPASTKRKN
jgi:tetratricopeptide (TPR) repeat protein